MFWTFLIPFFSCLPMLPNRSDKILVVKKIRCCCLVILDNRCFKSYKFSQTQYYWPRLIRVTQELCIIIRDRNYLRMWTAIQQVKELNAKLPEMVGSQGFQFLAVVNELGKWFEQLKVILAGGHFDSVDVLWIGEYLIDIFLSGSM